MPSLGFFFIFWTKFISVRLDSEAVISVSPPIWVHFIDDFLVFSCLNHYNRFIWQDTRAHAESAKEAIDGTMVKNRQVRVRFAVHGAALRVKELSPTVSNEMLYHAFSHFGDVERAVHIVDEKGRPTGEGIVEFERKPSANEALAQVKDKVFLLTAYAYFLFMWVVGIGDRGCGWGRDQ